jgi:hypothetical protein
MPTALPFELNGPDIDRLRAVLDGRAEFFSASVKWQGQTYTVLVAKEGASSTAQPTEPEAERPSGYAEGHWKPDSPQARAAAPRIVTGPISAEPDG